MYIMFIECGCAFQSIVITISAVLSNKTFGLNVILDRERERPPLSPSLSLVDSSAPRLVDLTHPTGPAELAGHRHRPPVTIPACFPWAGAHHG